MAGYIGNKAVGLNVTTGDILGDVGVGGDVTVGDDLTVTDDAAIGGTLGVTGLLTALGNITIDLAALSGNPRITFDHDNFAAVNYIEVDRTSDAMEFAVNGAERFTIETNGTVTIEDGDLVFGTAGHGICLGATSATAANTLDDYEEGTFTVGFSGASMTLATATAHYTKVGSLVTWNFYSGASTVASASGTAKLTGLPFTVRGSSPSYVPLNIAHNSFFGGSATVGQQGYHDANGTFCVFVNVGTTTSSTFVNGSSKYIMVGGTYFTDA